jgi:hypothetical protein
MNRRQFVTNLAAGAAAIALNGAEQTTAPDPNIRQVLAMFKCHFDAGFIDTQKAVVDKYIEIYFPQAIQLAASQRASGADPYVWTTGSWLVNECLERTSGPARKSMEEALGRGDIAWHALPFTWQTEFLDVPTIEGCLGFSKSLDRRFGRTTTGAKMTDVPGHSRGLVTPLSRNGVTFLDIGVNSASTPPDVPDLFSWKDPAGASLTLMYHRLDYGGVVVVPDSPLAISVNVRNDNSGPHTQEEIRTIYSDLRRRFPNASIKAANLTDIANAIQPHASSLPVITAEIGDTWIYGVPSDPMKVARFREMLRLRREWISSAKWKIGDAPDLAFLRHFALGGEHTWGADTKTWLDFDHYTPDALAQMLDQPKYKVMTHSWVEKRADLQAGIETLPDSLRDEATTRLTALMPVRPGRKDKSATSLSGAHFDLALDPHTGSIVSLKNKQTQRNWASADQPLAVFSYQTLSKGDYERFLADYITVQNEWAPKDFGKPNIESFGAESRLWTASLLESSVSESEKEHQLLARLQVKMEGKTGCPEEVYLELTLPKAEPLIHLNLSWFGKRSNRLPEAIWLSFKPNAPRVEKWTLTKLEQPISPMDVIKGGNRHMHALSHGLQYKEGEDRFEIETLDAPVVSLGVQSPIYFSKSQPDITQGLHFSLFNNGWGTNYVQWFGEDMRFRFSIKA